MFESVTFLHLKCILYTFGSAQYVAGAAARSIPSALEVGQELTLPDTRRLNVLTQNAFTAESTLQAPTVALDGWRSLPVPAGERDWFERAAGDIPRSLILPKLVVDPPAPFCTHRNRPAADE